MPRVVHSTMTKNTSRGNKRTINVTRRTSNSPKRTIRIKKK